MNEQDGAASKAVNTVSHALGRLGALAGWWAEVGSGKPPSRVDLLWSAAAAAVPATRVDVRVLPLEPPPAVPDAQAWGTTQADAAADAGVELLLVSVPRHVSDDPLDVAPEIVAAHTLGMDPINAIGWPAQSGLDDASWMAAVGGVRDGLRRLRGLVDQQAILERLDSPAVAAGTALLVQAAARRTPALLDGIGALSCALLAEGLTPSAVRWWWPADGDGGQLRDRALDRLGLEPATRLGIRVENGTAARLGLALLEVATASGDA